VDIDKIWSQFGQQLKSFIKSRVGDAHIADDLTQELLIKSYKNLSSLKEHDRIDAWLFSIARNVINDYYRKKATNKESLYTEMNNIADSLIDDSPHNQTREALSHCVKPFIEQLPSKYRQTITSVDLEGISQKAVADKLGVSHSTIKSQTQRGRAQLNKLFKQCCDFEIDARGNVMNYEPKSEQCKCDH